VGLWCFRVGVVLVLRSGATAFEFEHAAARLEPCLSEQAMNPVARKACHGFKACWVKAQNPYHL